MREIDITWQPSAYDLHWTHQMLSLIKDGGAWGVPMNGNIYRISHKHKTMTLVAGDEDDLDFKTGIVLRKLGWTLVYPTKDP